jgi:hypothetical protein
MSGSPRYFVSRGGVFAGENSVRIGSACDELLMSEEAKPPR